MKGPPQSRSLGTDAAFFQTWEGGKILSQQIGLEFPLLNLALSLFPPQAGTRVALCPGFEQRGEFIYISQYRPNHLSSERGLRRGWGLSSKAQAEAKCSFLRGARRRRGRVSEGGYITRHTAPPSLYTHQGASYRFDDKR